MEDRVCESKYIVFKLQSIMRDHASYLLVLLIDLLQYIRKWAPGWLVN